MTRPTTTTAGRTTLIALAAAALLAACGGGGNDATSTTQEAGAPLKQALKGGGGDCIGSCTGGGGTPVPGATNPLPTVAPAPDVLYRESFGAGPDVLRPKGGKGDMRSTFVHTTIGGFWVEWPGSKNTQWLTPNGDQTWKFCGTNIGPYELPSPLQPSDAYAGCAASEWFDLPIPEIPTALLPVTLPAGAWQLSMEGYPAALPGAYVAIGLTSSGTLLSNFATSGAVWLSLRSVNGNLVFELRLNGSSGPVLASGTGSDEGWNRMVIAYDPVARQLSASVNGAARGPFAVTLPAIRYAGFEGVGIMDNFVIRKLP